MAGRVSDRTKRRTPCTFTLHGRHQNAFVLDLSRSGMFIQTSADADPGDRIDIEVVFDGKVLPMHVEVARRKKVPPQLLTVAHGGIGVRILSAPEGYYEMLGELSGPSREVRGGSRGSAGPAPAADARVATEPDPNFRVRVAQVKGTRSRTLRVYGRDEADARERVGEDLGEEWKILEVSPL